MNRRFILAAACVIAVCGCGPGSDVNGFPSAAVQAYCHFAYHCCTPSERATFPNGFDNTAQQYNFDNESDCNQKLSESAQVAYQAIQASVKDKRITWNSSAAQSCIDAVNKAASSCSAQAYIIATQGDPTMPGTKAVCDQSQFVTGTVAASGPCTISADCSGTGSDCTPPKQTGTTQTVTSGGTCTPLPTVGQMCQGQCEPGNSCCNAQVCVALQATGASCTSGGGGCSAQPCDATKDFCGWNGTALLCSTKIAGGQPCGKDMNGVDLPESCQSNQCTNGSCTAAGGQAVTYSICTGNSDGF